MPYKKAQEKEEEAWVDKVKDRRTFIGIYQHPLYHWRNHIYDKTMVDMHVDNWFYLPGMVTCAMHSPWALVSTIYSPPFLLTKHSYHHESLKSTKQLHFSCMVERVNNSKQPLFFESGNIHTHFVHAIYSLLTLPFWKHKGIFTRNPNWTKQLDSFLLPACYWVDTPARQIHNAANYLFITTCQLPCPFSLSLGRFQSPAFSRITHPISSHVSRTKKHQLLEAPSRCVCFSPVCNNLNISTSVPARSELSPNLLNTHCLFLRAEQNITLPYLLWF